MRSVASGESHTCTYTDGADEHTGSDGRVERGLCRGKWIGLRCTVREKISYAFVCLSITKTGCPLHESFRPLSVIAGGSTLVAAAPNRFAAACLPTVAS